MRRSKEGKEEGDRFTGVNWRMWRASQIRALLGYRWKGVKLELRGWWMWEGMDSPRMVTRISSRAAGGSACAAAMENRHLRR